MKRKSVQRFMLAILMAVIVSCSLLAPDSAYAWATKTHGYSANVLLEDAADGFITIDGEQYRMPEEYATALRMYPEAFRAGALGPDFYPDMLTGQTYIHPYDEKAGVGVGDWLMVLVNAVNSLPKHSDQRMQALAFTLGMAVHFAGDEFGHDFINAFAGSAYPAYIDVATGLAKDDPTKLYYILRHMLEETCLDNRVESRLGNKTDVAAPVEFIMNTWIYNGTPNAGIAEIYNQYNRGESLTENISVEKLVYMLKNIKSLKFQYLYLVELRTALYRFANRARTSPISPFFISPAIAAYIDAWIDDLDLATLELVRAFDGIAHDMLAGVDGKDSVDIVKDRLQIWWDDYGTYASPLPDWPKKIAKALSQTEEWVLDQLGITEFLNRWEKFKDELINDSIQWGLSLTGFNYEEYKKLLKQPEGWLSFFLQENGDLPISYADLKEYIMNPKGFDRKRDNNREDSDEGPGVLEGKKAYDEFMSYLTAFDNDPEALEAFYNTLIMGKLILMGPDNLNSFFAKYGVTSSFENAQGKIMTDELCAKIHTAQNSLFSGYGTDDNVYMDVFGENGRKIGGKLLDKSAYNDFESNDLDEYYVELNEKVSPDQITVVFRIEKYVESERSPDQWTPDRIEITCRSNGVDVLPAQTVLDGERTLSEWGQVLSLPLAVNPDSLTYISALNPAIISYMKSNDNSTQWVNSKSILWTDMTARRQILYEVFHGFKPEITLKPQTITCAEGAETTLTGEFTSYWNGVRQDRREKEQDRNTAVNETKQKKCTGIVRIMEVGREEKLLTTGTVADGKMTVNLPPLTPGIHRLRADYDGDAFNGSAQSNIVTVAVGTEAGQEIIDQTGMYKYVLRQDGGFELLQYLGEEEHAVIPDIITAIGDSAFVNCTGLTGVTIPDSVTSIGNEAFSNCSSLASLVIPDSVTSIGSGAFRGCSGLTSIVLPHGITSIREATFHRCFSLASVEIPESVTSIGRAAFTSCSSLTSIVIPDGVPSIDDDVFSGCSSLTSVVIPGSVTSIGQWSFEDCSSLASVIIPDRTTSISLYAFRNCSSLTSVLIPASVTWINGEAFIDCSSDLIITVVPDSYAEQFCIKNNYLYQYARPDPNDPSAELHNYPKEIIVTDPTGMFIYVVRLDGNVELIKYLGNEDHAVVPDSVTIIGSMVFADHVNLTSITLPSSVTAIDHGAFYGCTSLIDCTIPGSVTSIGAGAFACCSSLTSMIIPNSVTAIGDSAFSDCESLTSVTIPGRITTVGRSTFSNCTSLTGITLPDSVTSIDHYAFSGCSSLTSIAIPDRVTSIGVGSFAFCTNLSSIAIPDSVATIRDRAFAECSEALVITVVPGSYAEQYCIGNGLAYQYDGID